MVSFRHRWHWCAKAYFVFNFCFALSADSDDILHSTSSSTAAIASQLFRNFWRSDGGSNYLNSNNDVDDTVSTPTAAASSSTVLSTTNETNGANDSGNSDNSHNNCDLRHETNQVNLFLDFFFT